MLLCIGYLLQKKYEEGEPHPRRGNWRSGKSVKLCRRDGWVNRRSNFTIFFFP